MDKERNIVKGISSEAELKKREQKVEVKERAKAKELGITYKEHINREFGKYLQGE